MITDRFCKTIVVNKTTRLCLLLTITFAMAMPSTATQRINGNINSNNNNNSNDAEQNPTQPPSQPSAIPNRRRLFRFWRSPFQWSVPRRLLSMESIMTNVSFLIDGFVYLLGPFLILFASVIISGLSYTYFYILLTMIKRANAEAPAIYNNPYLHTVYVCFILTNVIFNYIACVTTSNKGQKYERVVRELADATDFVYPETQDETRQAKRDFEDKIIFRMQRQQARAQDGEQSTTSTTTTATTTTTTTTTTLRGWMLLGPHEWGFCNMSFQPKPPRSHYDHITKTLVLNMDHFCPWMFNTVGYFNYRYFCNFLFFVFWGMAYGTIISFRPFREISSRTHWKQDGYNPPISLKIWKPTQDEQTPIAFSFMLCLSVGLAVLSLGAFHAYLLLTSQTTIEFHGNCANKKRAKRTKTRWRNPYDLGLLRNFQQVYGSKHPILAMMIPSLREPEFLPIPIPGDRGRRHAKNKEKACEEDKMMLKNGPNRSSNIV